MFVASSVPCHLVGSFPSADEPQIPGPSGIADLAGRHSWYQSKTTNKQCLQLGDRTTKIDE